MIALRPNSNSENFEVRKVQAEVHNDSEEINSNDGDDIPYHIRKYAKPFTYGSVPKGFDKSALNHVDVDKPKEWRKPPAPLPPSPLMLRKRPSISPSRPVVHKTPTREEFEEMLMEKKAKSLQNPQNTIKKLVKDAAVEKDLDELQVKLNKRLALEQSHANSANNINDNNNNNANTNTNTNNANAKDNNEIVPINFHGKKENDGYEQDGNGLEIVEVERIERRESPIRKPDTPSFPELHDERCVSPYPMVHFKGIPTTYPANSLQSKDEHRDNKDNKILTSNAHEFHEVAPHLVQHAKDTSEFWYKPNMNRQEAVALLRNSDPGTFLIRNSTTYKNAYGLVLRVSKPPSGIQLKEGSNNDELVRHFLLEPNTRGVRLKGCANEPLFASLSAFVYEHSINPLALPCKLNIPMEDILNSSRDHAELIAAQKALSLQGAACNVLYLYTYNTESLTGDEAIRRTVNIMFAQRSFSMPVEVHFKVTQQGITLTDNTRTKFFRRFYAANNISHCGLDPEKHFWNLTMRDGNLERVSNKAIFAFVARPLIGSKDNECHVFCDLAETQPASAIVSFINKVIPINRCNNAML